MTWTAPATVAANDPLSAAFWNTQVRDNLLATAAATALAAGDLVYADAANSMGSRLAIGAATSILVSDGSAPGWRTPGQSIGDGSYTAASSAAPETFADLDDSSWQNGTSVAITRSTGTAAKVSFGCQDMQNNTPGNLVVLSFPGLGCDHRARR